MDILKAVGVLGALGLVFGIVLGIAGKIFEVKVDPKVAKIRELLPGANCGACGFPGCDGMSKAMASGEMPATGCPVSNADAVKKISEVLGVEAVSGEKMVAKVLCKGCEGKAVKKFDYDGIKDCKAAMIVQGGDKLCAQGCLGYGSCVKVCDFDAIKVVNGVAVVDKEKCTSCGKCIEECPKHIIELVPYKQEVIVECKNTDFGKAVKEECKVGCIGCKMCERSCPFGAIKVENNIAKIDYTKCKQCLVCVAKCPTGAISGQLDKRVKAHINDDLCVGCGICKKNCPVEAIDGEMKQKHIVDEAKCIGCSVCFEKCPKKAIEMLPR
ncbi:RnfABCDGE type electron transport complex subunit B [Sedimentibacter sp. zth1]|uniref:RnfABCDGE type electron transport complex subunit B n=1 Tax=Sedimentibacter sp. zth1 TaxID=2816908 RepID=UPI001A91C404|nr:RnfABCDGE type electron transport complex subunit B [Sedimentibacter sp. zth1]QSX07280.1 RnfABCDGE type electron transport complex subunit B [Sedimentibacter sp. zth1]